MNYRIFDLPVGTYITRLAVAGVAGAVCGECLLNFKNHPGTAQKCMKYSAVGGLVGGARGYLVGEWLGGRAIIFCLSQSVIVSCATFGFFSIRSAISNKKYTLPWREKQLQEVVVTSLSAGITGMGVKMFSGLHPKRMLRSLSIGLVLGFIGHLVYERGRLLRLEILLKKDNPDLIAELKEAEDYMDEQQYADPHYTGPVRATPWSDMARKAFHDLRQTRERMMAEDGVEDPDSS